MSATATLTVSGAEKTVGGKPDAGNIVVSFNGFVEAINYGQYSTPASLASGLAASLTRDFNEFGLFAHTGTVVNGTETNATVITLQLTDGNRFGPVNWTMPSTSFSLSETGFAAGSGSLPADSGTVTLSVNSATISTTNYTAGSTPSSIAAGLVSSASSSLVTLRSDGDQLYINATTSGSGADYPYSVSITHDSTDFSSPSFTISPTSGSLASTGANTTTNIYSYGVTNPSGGPGYDVAGNVLYLTNDTVMGSWAYSYDGMNRLVSGKASSGPYVSNSLPDLCWSYDGYGNRTHESFSNQLFVNAVGSPCQAASGATLKDTVANYTGTPNRITTSTSPYASGTVTYTYDGDGNVTGDGVNTYLYDADDRLCAVHGAGGMTGYQYDADGKRVGKGSITSMSCDITSNGYAPESDYVLDLGGDQMTEVSVVTPSSPAWVHTNVMADGVLIAT